MFVDISVSMDVTNGEHEHEVEPVCFGDIFLFMQGGPLAILKENMHVIVYLCGNFESKVPELPW